MNVRPKHLIVPLFALIGLGTAAVAVVGVRPSPTVSKPLTEPATAPFASYISGTGQLEPPGKSVGIGAPEGGLPLPSSAGKRPAFSWVGDTIRTLLGDVARYYINARGYQARIAVANETLKSRTVTWQITGAKAQGGTGTGLDEVQARAETESAAAAIPPLEYDFRESVNRLALLTGQPPQTVLDRMRAVQPIPQIGGAIEPDPPVVALARRPDIRAAERRIAAASADIGAAQADRYPAVTLAGSIGVNSATIRTAANASANVWSFGPTFSVPIFDAGKRRAKVDQKIAVRDEKIAAWQVTVRTAVEETENALVALDRERAHNIALRRTVGAYADALAVSQAQYRAGLANFLNVLDADRSPATQRDNLAQSNAALAVDAVALYKAMGGGWQDVDSASRNDSTAESRRAMQTAQLFGPAS